MKRFILFSTALLLAVAPLRAQVGAQFEIDGLTYVAMTDSTVSVGSNPFSSQVDDTVRVPEWVTFSGTTYHVVRLQEHAFWEQRLLSHIELPSSIRMISQQCFASSGLHSIKFPVTLDSILSGAFDGTAVDSLFIPPSTRYIDEEALVGMEDLLWIDAGSQGTAYKSADGVLYSADGSLLHSYPRGRIDTTFVVPDGVTRLGDEAFNKAAKLRSIVLPESLEWLGMSSFYGCRALRSIRLPEHVHMTGNAFLWCPALRQIEIDPANPYLRYLPSDTAIVSMDGDTLFYKVMNPPTITAPQGVRYIAPYALACNFSSVSAVLPEGVEEVAYMALYCNNSMVSVTLPSTLRRIGAWAFSYNMSLRSVTIPEGVTEMGEYAFFICMNVRSLTLPNSLKDIPYCAFINNSKLKHITFGDSLERVEPFAFTYAHELGDEKLTFPPSLRYVGDSAFAATSLTSVEFTGEVDSIGVGAFRVSTGLDSLALSQMLPPTLVNNAFDFSRGYVINIPCGSLTNYTSADVWREYGNYNEDCEGVEPVDEAGATVIGGHGRVTVGGAAGRLVEVFNTQGVRVAAAVAASDPQPFPLPAAGIYLVRIGSKTHKVAVR